MLNETINTWANERVLGVPYSLMILIMTLPTMWCSVPCTMVVIPLLLLGVTHISHAGQLEQQIRDYMEDYPRSLNNDRWGIQCALIQSNVYRQPLLGPQIVATFHKMEVSCNWSDSRTYPLICNYIYIIFKFIISGHVIYYILIVVINVRITYI